MESKREREREREIGKGRSSLYERKHHTTCVGLGYVGSRGRTRARHFPEVAIAYEVKVRLYDSRAT